MMGSQVNDTSKMGPSQLFKGWVPEGARSLFTDFMCVYGGGGGGRILDMRDVLVSQTAKVSALLELTYWRRKQKNKHTNKLLINTLQRIKQRLVTK